MLTWLARLAIVLVPLAGFATGLIGPSNLALIAFLALALFQMGTSLLIPLWAGPFATFLWLLLAAWVLFAVGFPVGFGFLGAALFFFPGAYLGRRKWEGAVLVGALAAAIMTLLHYFLILPAFDFEGLPEAASAFGGIHFGTSYIGLFGAREDYAIWAILGLLACTRMRGRLRLVFGAFIALAVIVLQSRSGWIALAVFLVGLVATNPLIRAKKGDRYVWAGLLVLLAIGVGLSDAPTKIATALVGVRPESAEYRSLAAATAIDMIRRHPMTGVGYNSRFVVTGGTVDHLVHNTPLFYGALFGLPAMALFVAFYGVLIVQAWRRRDYLTLSALVAVLVPLMLYSAFGSKAFWAFAGIIAGSLRRHIAIPVTERVRVRVPAPDATGVYAISPFESAGT